MRKLIYTIIFAISFALEPEEDNELSIRNKKSAILEQRFHDAFPRGRNYLDVNSNGTEEEAEDIRHLGPEWPWETKKAEIFKLADLRICYKVIVPRGYSPGKYAGCYF